MNFDYPEEDFDYPEDIDRIIKVCKKEQIYLTHKQAERIWQNHSEGYCAGWLFLPENDEAILRVVKNYLFL